MFDYQRVIERGEAYLLVHRGGKRKRAKKQAMLLEMQMVYAKPTLQFAIASLSTACISLYLFV